jgi:hypothetical protein
MRLAALVALVAVLIFGAAGWQRSAYAETANAEVFGTLNMNIESVRAIGATSGNDYPSHFRLIDDGTEFGVKGFHEVTPNLKGVFQVALDVRPAQGTVAGLRDTMVGLQGEWGAFFAGRWSTPFRVAMSFMEPLYGNGAGSMSPLVRTGGNSTTDPASFSLRRSSFLQYWSPAFHGVSARVAYSPKEAETGSQKYLVSGSLLYSAGPWKAALAHERHRDYVSVGQTDTGWQTGAGYTFWETTSLNLGWSQLSYRKADGVTSRKRAVIVAAAHKMGQFSIRGAAARAGDFNNSQTGDLEGTGAYQLTLVGSFQASKRLELYSLFSKITNEEKAFYNFTNSGYAGPSLATPTPPGADPRTIGLGMRLTF